MNTQEEWFCFGPRENPGGGKYLYSDKLSSKTSGIIGEIHIVLEKKVNVSIKVDGTTHKLTPNSMVVLRRMKTVPAVMVEPATAESKEDEEDDPKKTPTPIVPRGRTGQGIAYGHKDDQNEQSGDKSAGHDQKESPPDGGAK
eukprot:GHVS01088617.1.p1 GENE.GHVS01088617.1~~GHVS01088617.1.p1  ORF type:complete len:142 (+),score=13.34 GHVS01088617.1:209-634(+)